MDKVSDRWDIVLWVGKLGRTDKHAVLTLDGVQRCRSEPEQRDVEVRRQAFSLPWKLDGKSVHEHEVTEPTLDVGDGRKQNVTKRMATDAAGPMSTVQVRKGVALKCAEHAWEKLSIMKLEGGNEPCIELVELGCTCLVERTLASAIRRRPRPRVPPTTWRHALVQHHG